MTDIHKLHLDLGDKAYFINIGPGLLQNAKDYVPLDLENRTVFILADKNVSMHLESLKAGLDRAGRMETYLIDGGERAKSYTQLQDVLHWLLDKKVDRKSVLIALGGGVIGDLGGFAASIILRGIPYIQVPTTLLSQVDSSVGGKTGINAPHGKNLIGSFYQPSAVLCDLNVLKTLPERELLAGYAECVKHAVISDSHLFTWYEQKCKDLKSLDQVLMAEMIAKNCQIKASVVEADEKEAGKRALLNFGHTFGHALETAAQYDGRLLHGEGVSIGMVLAMTLSAKMELCPENDLERLIKHLQTVGLPTKISDINPPIESSSQDLFDLMHQDKKALAGQINFVLSKGIGHAFQTNEVSAQDVLAVLEESLKN